MRPGTFAVIILAGGLSSRMDRFKPLLPLGEHTFIEHIIDTYHRNDIDIIAVGGYRRDELFTAITTSDIVLVENPDYERGMFSSVVTGVRSLSNNYDAFFIQPVDIPLVRPATVRCLMEAFRDHPERIVYPVFRGRRGHPPLIPSRLIPDILAWNGEQGLKGVLDARGKPAVDVPVADGGIIMDSDTPDDYKTILERFARRDIPTGEEFNAIIEISSMSPDRISHGRVVAQVAIAIARKLRQAGHDMDIDIVEAAALLHDIAKGRPRHDAAGGEILREMGFERLADVIGIHTDLGQKPVAEPTLEARVVFLADKFVRDDRIVTLEERYHISQKQYARDADIEKHIRERKSRALQVKQNIEQSTGCPLEDIIDFPGTE